jgi:2-phosphoglycerate kinase
MVKNLGTDKLPLKLTGIEFALHPDYAYTISAVAKGALKTKGKEVVKQQATKLIEKVIQNDELKEKAGKLFKGLFK